MQNKIKSIILNDKELISFIINNSENKGNKSIIGILEELESEVKTRFYKYYNIEYKEETTDISVLNTLTILLLKMTVNYINILIKYVYHIELYEFNDLLELGYGIRSFYVEDEKNPDLKN